MSKPYERIKCGRCRGLGVVASWTFDGPMPDECSDCNGSGSIIRYESGRYAQWPGGPLLGRDPIKPQDGSEDGGDWMHGDIP